MTSRIVARVDANFARNKEIERMSEAEIREKLKPFMGTRIIIRGVLNGFGWFVDPKSRKEIGRACIAHPELDGEVVASHVWVVGTLHWEQRHRHDIGKQVEFTAVVGSYPDTKLGGARNYNLVSPDDLKLLHAPPALPIPDPPDDAPEPEPPCEDVGDALPVANGHGLEKLKQVTQFLKRIGGQKQACRAADALESVTMPLPELIQWIRTLGE
jgi:hypothetical protein